MKFGTTAKPHDLDAMISVVSRYCRHLGVNLGTPESEAVAGQVLALHEIGVRGEDDLLAALIVPNGPSMH